MAEDVTLAILAGGEGSRMGRPKGLLTLGGRPILQYLLDRFNWPGPTCLVTSPGREHPPGWQRFDRELVDPVAGQGPLRGVLTALEGLKTPLLAVVTVDMPGIGPEHLRDLLGRLRNCPQARGLMYCRRVEGEDQIEPFPLALRREAMPIISLRLSRGQFALRGLVQESSLETVLALQEWQATWTNLNEPADVSRLTEDRKRQLL